MFIRRRQRVWSFKGSRFRWAALAVGSACLLIGYFNSSPGVSSFEAKTLIRNHIGQPSPTFPLGLKNLTSTEIWEAMHFQVFSVTSSPREGDVFVIRDGQVYDLSSGFGGHGLHSLCVADLDQDGSLELAFCYSWGSGIHRSKVGVCKFTDEVFVRSVAPTAYLGDLYLKKTSKGDIQIEIGTYRYFWRPDIESEFGALQWNPPLCSVEVNSDLRASYVAKIWK